MRDKWTVIHDDAKAEQERKICYYCKRFWLCRVDASFACSGRLPQVDVLSFLMRKIKPTDTCKSFVLHKVYQRQSKQI
jgi:hypothetical protein